MENYPKKGVSKEMTFGEVLIKYPYLLKIFTKNNLHCSSCPMAREETIEDGARIHGITVQKLIEELNKEIEKYEKKNLP